MQPVPKAACHSDFRKKNTQNFCPQRNLNLGPLAQQASVLPLDHCDLPVNARPTVTFLASEHLHLAKSSYTDIDISGFPRAILARAVACGWKLILGHYKCIAVTTTLHT